MLLVQARRDFDCRRWLDWSHWPMNFFTGYGVANMIRDQLHHEKPELQLINAAVLIVNLICYYHSAYSYRVVREWEGFVLVTEFFDY